MTPSLDSSKQTPKRSRRSSNVRTLLFTGKGGVGKTSVAAASALRAAQLGYRTIIMSTDAAHSLADSFEVTLGPEPREIEPNLWGQEMDILRDIEVQWGTVSAWISAVMAWRGLDEIVAEELAVLPGMEDLSSLLHITDFHDSGKYDVVVVDTAPTGETLRLLSFPEVARWYMERLFPMQRKAVSVLRPVVHPFTKLPLPGDEVFKSVQRLFEKLDYMHDLLTDTARASVRLVVNPEKMVIREAQRTYTYLNLYGYSTDLVVCNRVFPEEVKDVFFRGWKETQAKYFQLIEESFAPLPLRTIPLFPQEVVGRGMLARMAKELYGEEDPTKLFFEGEAQQFRKLDGRYILSLKLPFTSKEKIGLLRTGDELIIQLGAYKRNIILPRILLPMRTEEAKFEGERLDIYFAGEAGEREGKPAPSSPRR